MVLVREDRRTADAKLEDVESAVRALDGVNHTLLRVELPSGPQLSVGGGPDLYVAELSEDDQHRWLVIDPSAGEAAVDLVVGGSHVEHSAKFCVGLNAVLDAVRTFVLERGARCSHLTWSVET